MMWTPHYYQEWSTRRSEVMELKTVADAIGYACRHGIAYVVETTDRLGDEALRRQVAPAVDYSNARYAVLRTAALCSTGR